MGIPDDWESAENDYLEAAIEYAKARVRYAETWQFERGRAGSDLSATQATIEITEDEVTVAYAKMQMLKMRLER